ncbi:type ISP restriction/modification enzyme [Dictyobacter arantiisoli]|uniref:site-specific DNA-methyltransferase (adenine-specific) n=1 Tax=Dictyobacter arantiisoli TaxID=2014874 RepID=A0A5A5TAV7_9CHLR|nr:type ISP restriction/modification enzyme [Dictyobacter arantiisoli]GCF08385.1 DNA methyltransferase [Dictyobacter arantiisoli]
MADALLKGYLDKIEAYFQGGEATEHTYRETLQNLLEQIGTDVKAINEPKRMECGAPDYVVQRKHDKLTIGYVEAKDVGRPLDKVEKDEQLKRYLRALDNLILTDYLEFRWYVQGEKRMSARLGSIRNKKIVLDKDGVKLGEELLQLFLQHRGARISKPEELAKRMARLAHMIRDIIIDAFDKKQASDNIKDLYTTFQNLLIPDLTTNAFADMFAQTIAYGLFAARYNHTGNAAFTRRDAASEIPRTNPFLRKFFGAIAGQDLDDEPFVGFVDELAQVLAFTDMEAVLADFGKRTRQEDPIVHFYETFLSQYDPKMREMRGVYYTPEPVVSYIVRSVDHLLREHFDCAEGLADTSTVPYSYTGEDGKEHIERTPRVMILDPATGTGTFLYNVIAHIRESYQRMGNAGMWSGYVREHLLPRLFGFELLVAPYAMAHLKLSMQLAALDLPPADRKTWAYDFKTNERLGIYLTNTLDEALKRSDLLMGRYISDEANEAARVKQNYPVMVILGNPPYSGHSANNGDWIKDLLHGKDAKTGRLTGNYFEVDGQSLGERNPKWLNDDYVKFIRFAQWRIEQTGHGILAFITNHGYLDNPTFRGMRQSLMQSFDDIYILDLHGNSKKKERSPDGSKDENVFDIQQGTAIGIFVKRQKKISTSKTAQVHHAHLWGPREVYEKIDQDKKLVSGKYHWLAENDVTTTEWTMLKIEKPFYLFVPQDAHLREEYVPGWLLTDVFPINNIGMQTHRDYFVTDVDNDVLRSRITQFRSNIQHDDEIRELFGLGTWNILKARAKLRSDNDWEKGFTQCLWRPFDIRSLYYHKELIDRPRQQVTEPLLKPNLALLAMRQIALQDGCSHFLVTNKPIIDRVFYSNKGAASVFPLYIYPDKKVTLFEVDSPTDAPGGRHPNLSTEFIKDFANKLNLHFIEDGKGDLQQTFGPEDIFNYMYAVFHAPMYRERYAEFLKIDFPRLPLTSDVELFRELCALGERLVGLHLMEKVGKQTAKYPVPGNNVVEKIDYTQRADAPDQGRVWINKTQYFEGVPSEVWDFHVGGYQVCQKWLKDRKGRRLDFNDIMHYQRIVAALSETITLMEKIDIMIDEHGGWPLA